MIEGGLEVKRGIYAGWRGYRESEIKLRIKEDRRKGCMGVCDSKEMRGGREPGPTLARSTSSSSMNLKGSVKEAIRGR